MKAFTVAIHFCTVSFFNYRVNCVIYSCELCVYPLIYVLNLRWYQSLNMKRHLSYYRSILGSFFLAKLLLLVLHQKRRIYHLISQVKESLIKLAWSTMLGVKEIPKVQTIDLIFSVWLCDLQVYHSSSLHSLQAAQSPS